MNSIGKFRGECDIRIWLCQIAKNSYYSYLKKNSRVESVEDIELENMLDPNIFIDERIVNRETTEHIQKRLFLQRAVFSAPLLC